MPPKAKKIPYSFNVNGHTINDDYAWLRSASWPQKIDEQDIIEYLEEENAYYQNYMQSFDDERLKLFEELKSRIQLTDQSTYVKKDEYYYYNRTEEHLDYPIYCRKKGSIDAKEEIILDLNIIAEGEKFTAIGSLAPNPSHNLLAYSVDLEGDETYIIYIYDLVNQQLLSDRIPDTCGNIIWHQTEPILFYTPVDKQWRHNKVKYHKLGNKWQKDKIIFDETDPLFAVNIQESASKEIIFIESKGHDSTEIYYINIAKKLDTRPKLITQRRASVQYQIEHDGTYFYKRTNDKAKNFHIVKCLSDNFSPRNQWEICIDHDETKYLFSFDITKNYLLLKYKNNGIPELIVHDKLGNKQKPISFPEVAYTAHIYSTNFLENDIRITYSSLSRPATTFQYDPNDGKLHVMKSQKIPLGFKSDDYQVERIFADTEDEVQVPITLIYKKSLFKKDGKNPLYLYGYGAYGIAVSASFRNSTISMVDRGFVFAIAHIRGGDELGQSWYEDAKFLNKKRTFTDFIRAAEVLCTQQYTSQGNIIIAGGSAGGMLVGAVMNMRPELFKAVIAHVPFVDVLNTMLDDTLPLTPGEFKEWGNPKMQGYFEYIKSYSPYDNVTQQNYPALLVTAGLADPRVGYWEAAKWVAKLRELKKDDNTLIFKTNMKFGHAGASRRFDYLLEIAEDLVFIFHQFESKA
ncbi:MAG: S9 family peptidase [Rickettsiaceae bacterium]|nr:S9 family peptidase [Rickettsiaceae bacterium]